MINQIKDEIKKEERNEKALTENGAIAYKTSGKALLDLNFNVASYRGEDKHTIYEDFIKAFDENDDIAIKWLFFTRDIRGGLGERQLFRSILTSLVDKFEWSDKLERLFSYISEYGRWDDLLIVFNTKETKAQKFVSDLLKTQLQKDSVDMAAKKSISLCAKWLPSESATSIERKHLARKLATLWGISFKEYRKKLSELRNYIDVTEIKTSSKKWGEINYEKVPSKANLKYRAAFYRHDGDRFKEYLDAVERGEKKINSATNFPHDIVHLYTASSRSFNVRASNEDAAIEQLWKALPTYELSNTLVVADGSGSMTCPIDDTSKVMALDVANALAIYCSERNAEPYRNKYITFSDNPKYVEFKETDSLYEKLRIAFHHNEVASTNIEKVFQIILNTAINNRLTQEEFVKNILIISDMEFNEATVRNSVDDTLFNNLKIEYSKYNYLLPRLIFWNVNSRTKTIPVQENKNGVTLVSGFSPHILKMVLSDNLDPYGVLLEILNSERYKKITWN
jgi:hypothetical protein